MVRILICYASWSGNTKEVAEIIESILVGHKYDVTMHRIGSGDTPDPSDFDAMIIGSFTWGKGQTPSLVKDFVYNIGYKPPNVFVFGTGDTQFGGDDLFCNAAVKLGKFYETTYEVLKIEQSPRNCQEDIVTSWTEGVIQHCLK